MPECGVFLAFVMFITRPVGNRFQDCGIIFHYTQCSSMVKIIVIYYVLNLLCVKVVPCTATAVNNIKLHYKQLKTDIYCRFPYETIAA